MDFATHREFHIACWRPPAPGSYVAARDAEGRALVGRVRGLTGPSAYEAVDDLTLFGPQTR
jgi:hypothetical protein